MARIKGVRYDLPLYEQITKASSAPIFSKAVRYLIERYLYKVQLPIEVREAFVNDIAELYYRKFGYVSTMDDALSHTLAEYFLQNDVKVNGSKEPDCAHFEYPFESARMRVTNNRRPYRKEVPIDHETSLDVIGETLYDNITPLDELEVVESALDIHQAIELANLTEMEKELIWLNVVVGMNVRDIAALDDKYPSKTTIAVIIRKTKEKLKKAVLKTYEK